jgi:hypothetical protein
MQVPLTMTFRNVAKARHLGTHSEAGRKAGTCLFSLSQLSHFRRETTVAPEEREFFSGAT